MHVVKCYENVDTLLEMYRMVAHNGLEIEVRGQKTKNIHNLAVVLKMDEAVITDFNARKFNLKYAKEEWLWYLRHDKFDDSIEKHATMWKKLKQPDGSYFSNYGQYIFDSDGISSQYEYVIDMLKRDINTRRASMTLLSREHLFPDNLDTVCTYAINFTIEMGALHMTVMMRSNDVIFGFTNDSFCFAQLYYAVYVNLCRHYPHLWMGNYTHFTNSMHVYERHYDMIEAIIKEGREGFNAHVQPTPTVEDIRFLTGDRSGLAPDYTGSYTAWLQA